MERWILFHHTSAIVYDAQSLWDCRERSELCIARYSQTSCLDSSALLKRAVLKLFFDKELSLRAWTVTGLFISSKQWIFSRYHWSIKWFAKFSHWTEIERCLRSKTFVRSKFVLVKLKFRSFESNRRFRSKVKWRKNSISHQIRLKHFYSMQFSNENRNKTNGKTRSIQETSMVVPYWNWSRKQIKFFFTLTIHFVSNVVKIGQSRWGFIRSWRNWEENGWINYENKSMEKRPRCSRNHRMHNWTFFINGQISDFHWLTINSRKYKWINFVNNEFLLVSSREIEPKRLGKEKLFIRRKTDVSFVCLLGFGQHFLGIRIEDAPNVLKSIIEPK